MRWSRALSVLLWVTACAEKPQESDPPHVQEILAWRQKRLERLQSDTGYLTLAGLFWLREGENTFGSDPSNDFVFPAHSAPPRAGVFVHRDGLTSVRALPGTPLTHAGKPVEELQLPYADDPTVVRLGDLSFFVIRRGDRYAIRMRDLQSEIRKSFGSIDYFPVDPAYRVTARFEPYEPAKQIPIVNIVGTVDTLPSPGAFVFNLRGRECRLDPVLEAPTDTLLFVIFRDATTGEETYESGRFLYTDFPANGEVVVDFNKAYNPPCAFSPYTTCPLPPVQNDLAVAVRAGEKKYVRD